MRVFTSRGGRWALSLIAVAAALMAMAGSVQAEGSVGVEPTVKAKFTCNSVTFFFEGFPNAANNTVTERVQVNFVTIFKGKFTFNGPSGTNTVSVSVPPGHHKIKAAVSWNTNGVKGEKDMPKPGGITCPPHVYVGYADSNHFEQGAHPTPWLGEAGVIFEGCGYGGTDNCPMSEGEDVYDAGAIRIDAPAKVGLTVSGASVQVGPCSYAPWPGLNVSVPAGGILILTQTGKHKCTEINTAEQDNFDTSESFLKSTAYQEFLQTGECSNDGYIPEITLTINGKTTTINDSGQVLNGGGMDPDLCQKIDEAQNWVQIQ